MSFPSLKDQQPPLVRSRYTIEQQVALTLHLQPLNTPQKKKSQLNTTEEEEVDERAPVGQSRVSE